MVDTIASLRTPIANGQGKAIGVTSATSSRLLPGVKSVAERGIAGYELVGWTVLYAPKGLGAETARTLAEAVNHVLACAQVQEKLLDMEIDPLLKSGEELKTCLAAEKDKWGRLIRASEFKPD